MTRARFLVVQGQVRRYAGDLGPSRSRVTAAGPSPAWVSWLLLGGNNRELGRGCVPFVDEAECLTSIGALIEAAAELKPVITADLDASYWRWRVESAGAHVAAGGRVYHRRRECSYALNLFIAALPLATPPAAPPRILVIPWQDWSRPADLVARRAQLHTGLPSAPRDGEPLRQSS